ncbi:heptosyltransferase family protein [Caballeronia udeis]|uniref:Heptosyltransferase family protein n=2 Tax=Caballeronia udeis TaxID=1232866 RepID=A0A158IKB5_9BURK|nr:heptosyltransferase family protein [Caballeronia udeis]
MNARTHERMTHSTNLSSALRAPVGRVAFVTSNAIGDTLVSMVIVRNLMDNSVDVTVYGTPAHTLRHWFPGVAICALPQDGLTTTFAGYDTVFQMQWNQPLRDLVDVHPHVVTLHDVEFGNRPGCMAQRFADFCRDDLALREPVLDNGITAPAGLVHRRNSKRVMIHPEASTEDKRWFSHRFVRLAQRLRKRGYDVQFVIAPHERERWRHLAAFDIPAPRFENLHELACCVYESGWFIGNDSGIGHLASNLGIPSLSLFRRRGVAERWRPAWGVVDVVLPWQWVPTAYLKEKLWRQTLTCNRVLAAFARLTRQASRTLG